MLTHEDVEFSSSFTLLDITDGYQQGVFLEAAVAEMNQLREAMLPSNPAAMDAEHAGGKGADWEGPP